jgi:hypothetical protein
VYRYPEIQEYGAFFLGATLEGAVGYSAIQKTKLTGNLQA